MSQPMQLGWMSLGAGGANEALGERRGGTFRNRSLRGAAGGTGGAAARGTRDMKPGVQGVGTR